SRLALKTTFSSPACRRGSDRGSRRTRRRRTTRRRLPVCASKARSSSARPRCPRSGGRPSPITRSPEGRATPGTPARRRAGPPPAGGGGPAVVLGMGNIHLGPDGGGSIRIPPAFGGSYGIKPTRARVPAWPASPLGTLAHAGCLTRSVADAALALTIMAAPDTRDVYA